jgi:hypothetical protein
MPLLKFENPTITQKENRPTAFENDSFPYNALDDRRFEELIYSVYKQEIESGLFPHFDRISLMSGVRDSGRDCALFKNGKSYGNIQCKKYSQSLSKEQFGIEITKFALYSLLEPTLIHDKDKFTYYIAVSKGFVKTCSDFIDDFNHQILYEPSLPDWIKKNILKPTLNSFQLNDPTDKIYEILSKIKVEKIVPQDLDALLSKVEHQNLQSLFFQARTVTDNSEIEKLSQKLDERFANDLSSTELNKQLLISSVSIKSQRNEFEGIKDSHIPRNETEELFKWINSPLNRNREGKEENICLLAGNAGMGKTVIIKDLYEKLLEQNIPVLALKADRIYASSLIQLQEKINLSISLLDFIEQCKQKFANLVILIDQIDALSQSLSSDRSFMFTYTDLIETYKHDSIVRIIISVRIFDLLYDPSLKVYKHIKKVEVTKLNEDAVLNELKKIGLNKNNISNNLLALLRTPNHLDVFSRIYNDKGNFAGINSIQDLYAELWKQKLNNIQGSVMNSERLTDLLFLISEKMFELQQITVDEQLFDKYFKELNYLKSEQIIKIENKEIQFFHQSFYDYVFARRFVENKKAIEELIRKENQSLMIRSSLKMILNYLRLYDHKLYIEQFEKILNGEWIFFHIKHLLISNLASLENPSKEEKNLFYKIILNNQEFSAVFFDHVFGEKWIVFLISSNVLKDLFETKTINIINTSKIEEEGVGDYKNVNQERNLKRLNRGLNILRRNLSESQNSILSFVSLLKDEAMIFDTLYFLKSWDNPLAFELLNRCDTIISKTHHDYYHILEEAVNYNPEYVFEKVKTTALSYYHKSDSQTQYYESRIVKKLFEKTPQLVSEFLIKEVLLTTHTEYSRTNNSIIGSDYDIDHFNFSNTDEHDKEGYILKALANYLQREAKDQTDFFKNFIYQAVDSHYLKALRFLVYAWKTNEKKYVSEIFSLIIYLFEKRYYEYGGALNYEIRNLIRNSFQYFNIDQQNKLLAEIKNINIKDEIYSLPDQSGKRHFYSHYGLTKFHFLNAIPINIIVQDKELNQEYKVLNRKFLNVKDEYNNRSSGGVVRAPLSITAYEKMNNRQWISSFKKYNSEHRPWSYENKKDFLKGGLTEHYRAFKEQVKKNPSKYLDLIEEIIENTEVLVDYPIAGIEGLLESKKLFDKVSFLLKKVIRKSLTNSQILYCIWIADHLIAKDVYDEEILNFIIYNALNNADPTIEKINKIEEYNKESKPDLISTGINSVRGAACRALTYVENNNYEDIVFRTLQKVFKNDLNVVKAAAFYHFAYLMNLNKEKAFNLFLEIINKKEDEQILPYGIWSSQYLIHFDFTRLTPYFEKLIAIPNLPDDREKLLSSILFVAWLYDYPNSEVLFKDFLNTHLDVLHSAIGFAIDNFYFKDKVSKKSLEVIEMGLNFEESKISKKFELEFLHMDEIEFEDIYETLIKYIQSKVFKISKYFLEYLIFNSNQHVYECIYLFELAINNENIIDETERIFLRYEDDATKFIIGAYTKLKSEDSLKSLQHQTKLLELFDKILVDDRFKNNVEMVLEKIIE